MMKDPELDQWLRDHPEDRRFHPGWKPTPEGTEYRALGKGPMPADRDGLEVIQREWPGRVVFRSTELIAQCPLTGQPDLYQVELTLDGDLSLESKSLKLYLWSWAGVGIFAEHLADVIATDVHDLVGGSVTVELVQSVRGGITTTVHASRVALPAGG